MSTHYHKATTAKELWELLRHNRRDHADAIDDGFSFLFKGAVNTNWGSVVSVDEPMSFRLFAQERGLPTAQHHSDSGPSYWRAGFGPLPNAEAALERQRKALADARAALDAENGLTLADHDRMFNEMEKVRNDLARDVAQLAQQIKMGDSSKETAAAHDRRKRELQSAQRELGIVETKRAKRQQIDVVIAKAVDDRLVAWVDALKAFEKVLEREQKWHDTTYPKTESRRVLTTP